MRRRIAACLLAVMLLAAACSKAKGPAPAPAPPGTVTLKVLDLYSYPQLDALIAAFYAQNPNIRIEKVTPDRLARPNPITDGWVAGKIRDEKIDILPAPIAPDLALPLDAYVQKSTGDLHDMAATWETLRWEGQLYEVPITVTVPVIAYNKAMFQAAKVPFPQPGWTWDDLREVAAKLTTGEGDAKVWGFAPNSPGVLPGLIQQQEAPDDSVLSDETFRKMLQLLGTMVKTDKSVPPLATSGTDGVDTSHLHDFANGLAAMTITYAANVQWMAPTPFPADVVPVPTLTGKPARGYAWTSALGIAKASAHPDEAWQFLQFAAGPKGAEVVARAGGVPLYQSDAVRRVWRERQPALTAGMLAVLGTEWRPITRTPKSVMQNVWEAYSRAIEDTQMGTVSWEDAYATYQRVAPKK